MIGPRVVLSGYAKTNTGPGATSTTAVVALPQNLPGNWVATFDDTTGGSGTTPPTIMDYAIFVSPYNNSGTATYVSNISTSAGDTTGQQTFTITSSASTWVFWQIVRVSNSSVSAYPTHN